MKFPRPIVLLLLIPVCLTLLHYITVFLHSLSPPVDLQLVTFLELLTENQAAAKANCFTVVAGTIQYPGCNSFFVLLMQGHNVF